MWKNDGLDKVQLKLLEKKIIIIHGEIDGSMAMYVREALLRLTSQGNPPVIVKITSKGGNVRIGLDIYDMLRSYSGELTGIVHGFADSMAGVILQACRKRVAMRHATMLLHHISTSEVSLDTLRDWRKTKKVRGDMEKSQRMIYKVLSDRTGRSIREIREVCAKEQSMDAREALRFHFIDEIR